MPQDALSSQLLQWYDRMARDLPWRVSPAAYAIGKRPNAYFVWLSEIMLQQTTVATVGPYFTKFTHLWPTVEALAGAEQDDVLSAWAGLGYYARARNLHKCAKIVAQEHGGRFPQTEQDLLKLPGVGPYTAAAIAAIAFDAPAVVVDGNVERVMARMFAIQTPLPDAKPQIKAAATRLTPQQRPGDYAQAVMDLGATICTPKRPACGLCPWRAPCEARVRMIAEELPRKKPKAAKPIRYGAAFLAQDAKGRLLLRKRPERGLLGGMLGLPGGEWSEDEPSQQEALRQAPCEAAWSLVPGEARHTFTHFHLRLKVLTAHAQPEPTAQDKWLLPDELPNAAIPTVMMKALKLALAA